MFPSSTAAKSWFHHLCAKCPRAQSGRLILVHLRWFIPRHDGIPPRGQSKPWFSEIYPLVSWQKAIENGNLYLIYAQKMWCSWFSIVKLVYQRVIFRSINPKKNNLNEKNDKKCFYPRYSKESGNPPSQTTSWSSVESLAKHSDIFIFWNNTLIDESYHHTVSTQIKCISLSLSLSLSISQISPDNLIAKCHQTIPSNHILSNHTMIW